MSVVQLAGERREMGKPTCKVRLTGLQHSMYVRVRARTGQDERICGGGLRSLDGCRGLFPCFSLACLLPDLFVLVWCSHVGSWSCEDCLHMIAAVGKRTTAKKVALRYNPITASLTRVTTKKDPSHEISEQHVAAKIQKKGRCNTTLRWQSIKIEKAVGCLFSTRNRPQDRH